MDMDIFEIYAEEAVEKSPRWSFYTPRKPRNQQKRIGVFFMNHPLLYPSNFITADGAFEMASWNPFGCN